MADREQLTEWQGMEGESLLYCKMFIHVVWMTYSKRGNPIIVLYGYRYSLKNTKESCGTVIRRWQCSTHTNRGCLSSIMTNDQVIVHMKNEHNHPPSITKKGKELWNLEIEVPRKK
ncbi:unnamed protein product [Leptosia nina]|uniref:FLYWCH-type domain-containing protein n=1 Tax=Leptosia nina TaxID=320188 RepID=A0AAV1J4T8_9NEOP